MLGDWTIPRIATMRTEQARKLSEFRIPGRAGSIWQDLGTEALVIEISGSIYAEDEWTPFLDDARGKFEAGEPLTFVADILHATDLQYVLIESLVLEESSDRPDEISYRMRLRESPPPPPPDDPFGAIDSDLLDAAGSFVDGVSAALDAVTALGDLPDFSDPSSLLGGTTQDAISALDRLGGVASSIQSLFGSA
jgi:hypothetical protein